MHYYMVIYYCHCILLFLIRISLVQVIKVLIALDDVEVSIAYWFW